MNLEDLKAHVLSVTKQVIVDSYVCNITKKIARKNFTVLY